MSHESNRLSVTGETQDETGRRKSEKRHLGEQSFAKETQMLQKHEMRKPKDVT